jgi:DNA-binding response OmpR family regulator
MGDTPSQQASVAHVLVVEDDPLVGETIMAMLEDDFRATLVGDAATALTALTAPPPVQVMLLDCLLPGGGVLDLLDHADRLGVPVILTSGAEEAIARLGGQRPALPKPFTSLELTALVRATALRTD